MGSLYQEYQTQTERSLEYQSRLNTIYRNIHEAKSFEEVLPKIEKEMLLLLEAERLTVYQRNRYNQEIISRYKTGNEIEEFRLPLSPTSIAGFVALTHKPLRIENVYAKDSLIDIHPDLKFDESYDLRSSFRTQSMVVVPIKFKNTLLGVLQIINKKGGSTFNDTDLQNAQELSQVIGQKFHYDLQATYGPFDYLIHKKKITAKKLKELVQKTEKDNFSVAYLLMTEEGLLPEEIGESMERYYQVPFAQYNSEIELPQKLMKKLKIAYLRANRWVPIAGDEKKVIILIDDPNDTNRIMEIQQVLRVSCYEFQVGIKEDILRYLGGVVGTAPDLSSQAYLDDLIRRMQQEASVEEEVQIRGQESSISEDEAVVVRLVKRLIMDAVKLNASDIHIEPGKNKQNATVRMRIDGVCRQILQIPASHIRAVIARIKIISGLDIAEHRKPQDGKITEISYGKPIELRVATLPTVNGESVVLRVLTSGGALPFDKLNFSERNEKEVKRLISKPHGIFLVVGPTGSGKTTTLHAILSHINTPERKIWTAEDPVEITQPGLQQVQVVPKIGFDFATAMRAFLRADPDIILIGEMRDKETSHIGVEASLTGHLVFSTLHTNSAPETIIRLLDLGIDPLNFSDALLGIVAQRLVRTLCIHCKEPYSPTEKEYQQLVGAYGSKLFPELGISRSDLKLYKPIGCKKCGKIGYKGRTGIHELLVATPEMKRLIVRNSEVEKIFDLAIKEGMRTLVQDGISKVMYGQSDFLQLRRVTAG